MWSRKKAANRPTSDCRESLVSAKVPAQLPVAAAEPASHVPPFRRQRRSALYGTIADAGGWRCTFMSL